MFCFVFLKWQCIFACHHYTIPYLKGLGHFLFVCFGFIVPLDEVFFPLIWRRHYYRWRTANCDLCSAIMTIEQWWFFLETSVYSGHILGPVTLTPIAERLAVDLSLPVFTTYVCRDWDSKSQRSACEANALSDCGTAAVVWYVHVYTRIMCDEL